MPRFFVLPIAVCDSSLLLRLNLLMHLCSLFALPVSLLNPPSTFFYPKDAHLMLALTALSWPVHASPKTNQSPRQINADQLQKRHNDSSCSQSQEFANFAPRQNGSDRK